MTKVEKTLANLKLLGAEVVRQAEVRRCEESLRSFVRSAWSVIDQGVPYVHGWIIDCICEHLEAVASGDIRKLIINLPPRSGKSTLGAVAFPAWMWIARPEFKWLFGSYDLKLSMRDSRKCRALIGSAWYQRNWGDRFKILSNKGGQDTKQRFDNDKGGHRVATATDAGTVGEGGDCIFLDDANDIMQMRSEPYIESVIHFHEQVLASRLNDPKTGARICIQQRSSERDLTGHILSKELGWTHVVIPMEYGGKKQISLFFEDPRSETGELMWKERVGPKEVEEIKRTLGPVGYAGQYQQRPSPVEGAKFKREWWSFWNPASVPVDKETGQHKPIRLRAPDGSYVEKTPITLPVAFEQVVQSWDMAFKAESDSDLVAGHAWGRVGANVMLLKRDAARRDFPQTLAAVRQMSAEFPCPEKLVEDKANGPAVLQTLRNEIPGLIPSPIEGGLLALATSMTGYAEAGNIYLPNPDLFPWVRELIEQFAVFPNGKHDDDVSAASHAWRRLFDSVANAAAPEFRVQPRMGEPDTACHVKHDADIIAECPAHWRRYITVSPGEIGAALWICETPKGSLRVYRELNLEGLDAYQAGLAVSRETLPDIRRYMQSVHLTAKWNMDVFMEKEAFTPIEPIGSYAELLEQGLLAYEPTSGEWDERQAVKQELKLAKFSAQMAVIEDAAWDRLRDLLRFKPPEFQELPYNRAKAIALRENIEEYLAYMAAVEGQVHGEWPKIRFAASCKQTTAAVGAARRADDIENPFLRALLIGIAAPKSAMTPKAPFATPYAPNQRRVGPVASRMRGRRRMAI